MSRVPDNPEKIDETKPKFRVLLQPAFPDFSLEWREFMCGGSAAFFNIGLTYPIHKMIFRQMLHDVPLGSAFQQLRNEGFSFLYRGIFPPLTQKTISLSIMFGVYDGARRLLTETWNMGEYGAKCCAGLISGSLEAALLPFERVQTLLADQKYHTSFRNMPDCFRHVYANHGVRELFRGMVPVLFRNGPSNSMFFLLCEEASVLLPKHKNITLQSLQEFTTGAVIGGSLSALFYPFNVIKVSMQSDLGHPYEGVLNAARRIYKERGYSLRHFYRGCGFNALRASISWGVTNTAYENIKREREIIAGNQLWDVCY